MVNSENASHRPKPDVPRLKVNEHGMGTAKNLTFVYKVLTELVDDDWNSEALLGRIKSFTPGDTVVVDGQVVKKEGKHVWVAKTVRDEQGAISGAAIGYKTVGELSYAGVYMYGMNDLYMLSLKRNLTFKNSNRIEGLSPEISEIVEQLRV